LIKKDNFFVTHFSLNENVADSKQNRKSKAKLMYPPKLFRNSKEQKKSRLKYNLAFWLFSFYPIQNFCSSPAKKVKQKSEKKVSSKNFFFFAFFPRKKFYITSGLRNYYFFILVLI
jgi:hypothetical protein